MGMAAADPQFHVLAVDDSIIDRKLIERLLKTSSYQVTTVDSGSKALEFLGCHDFERSSPNEASVSPINQQEVEVSLVITDYCMPGMTGYDLLKKIKESSSLRKIPVVIMSSENVPSRINRCLEEGAEAFFLKPVRISDVKKLRPHIMKNKSNCKDEEDIVILKPEKEENKEESSTEEEETFEKIQLKTEEQSSQKQMETSTVGSSNNNNSNSNKRKWMKGFHETADLGLDTIVIDSLLCPISDH